MLVEPMVFHQWKSSLERLIVFQKVSEAVRVKQKLVLAFPHFLHQHDFHLP
jgi:hypothetical protein